MEKQNIGIFGRNFIFTFTMFFLILGLSALFFFREYIDVYKDNVKNNIITSAHLLTEMSEEYNEGNDTDFIKNYWNEFSKKNSSIYFCISDSNSNILGYYPKESVYKAYAKEHDDKIITASFKLNSKYNYKIEFFVKTSNAIMNALSNMPILWASLLILGFVASYLSASLIAKPIEQLTNETIRLKDINESPGMVTRTDEIGVLQESIYDLHQTLRNSIDDLETEMKHISKLEYNQRYFFAAASQEFKAPIASILAILESVKSNVEYSSDLKNKLDDCMTRIMTLEQLISELVEIIKYNDTSKNLPVQNISVLDAVNASVNECMPVVEKKKIILSRSVDKRVFIKTNIYMLNRVLMNVISNAIQHCDDGHEVRIWTEFDNHYATLYVYNECKPIPEDVLKKLFEPFYKRGDVEFNNAKHTGLGLYVVHELLTRMSIPYDMKNVNKGICFSIKFKRASNVAEGIKKY